MSFMFRTALEGMVRVWKKNRKESGLVASEAITTLERLSALMFTGNNAHVPTRVWNYIGLKPSLDNYGWPFIMPGRIDLSAIPNPRARSDWSLAGSTNRELVLSHFSSIQFHYGEAALIRCAAAVSLLSTDEIVTIEDAILKFRELIRNFMVPQLKEFVLKSFRERHSSISSISAAAATGSRKENELKLVEEEVQTREALLKHYRAKNVR